MSLPTDLNLICEDGIMFRIISGIVLLLIVSTSYADCKSGDKVYPEGKRVGPYVCEDGKWVRK